MELAEVIILAKKGNPIAQKHLYEAYKVPLFIVCLRYGRDRSEAEDILQEGFIKIFKHLYQYTGNGDIGGWLRKVMVNTALEYIRKWKKDWHHLDAEGYQNTLETEETIFHKLGLQELTRLIQKLPNGYRIVFNLFVIEGYSHKEIAELLGISENTSKTQLFKAKAALRQQVNKLIIT